jgi:hypothetical protein
MIEGITIKELAQTLNDALEDAPQLKDYVIDNFETVRIENNGFYLIKLYASGDYGQTCTIRKCLRPDSWRPEDV